MSDRESLNNYKTDCSPVFTGFYGLKNQPIFPSAAKPRFVYNSVMYIYIAIEIDKICRSFENQTIKAIFKIFCIKFVKFFLR